MGASSDNSSASYGSNDRNSRDSSTVIVVTTSAGMKAAIAIGATITA